MKKILANIIVLLLVAVAVFFIGWVQFLVKPGFCGIMTSKTGGIYGEPIVSGKFAWRWEKLLPTNAEMHLFSLSPNKSRRIQEGSLPSGELYASKIDGTADFSYKVEMDVSLELSAETIHALFVANKISSPEDLNSWYDSKAQLVCSEVANKMIQQSGSAVAVSKRTFSEAELSDLSSKLAVELEGGKICGIEVVYAKLPDFELYNMAKNSYSAYQKELDLKLKELATVQAKTIAEENRSMQQLEKFAALLKEYPQGHNLLL